MKNIIATLRHLPLERKPVWLMRQAGRWLPEYRKLRTQEPDFIKFCLEPDLAAEATIQPLKRLDIDAAIIFADILLVPFALGCDVIFEKGEGPKITPLRSKKDLQKLSWQREKVSNVSLTIKKVKEKLEPHHALIGFSGAPWTVACYMIEGRGKTGFKNACLSAKNKEPFFDELLSILEIATIDYLVMQIEAGAEVLQIFDSWAGLLSYDDNIFRKYVINPTKNIVSGIKKIYPSIPIIGFPRGASLAQKLSYTRETGVDALGVGQNISIKDVRDIVGESVVLQGNLDPEILVEGGKVLEDSVCGINKSLRQNHIFNLGHGVLPNTPIENVEKLIELVRRT